MVNDISLEMYFLKPQIWNPDHQTSTQATGFTATKQSHENKSVCGDYFTDSSPNSITGATLAQASGAFMFLVFTTGTW